MRTVEFYFDFASPNCYVALPRLKEICSEKGLSISYAPVLLGGLFKSTIDAPVTRDSNEYRYMVRNLERISKKLALSFNPPHERFPINSLRAMRGFYYADSLGKSEEFVARVFEACWSLDIDISNALNLKSILPDGIKFDALLSFIERDDTKERLRRDTEAAYNRGVFGAPTYFVGNDMYWGTPEVLWYLEKEI